MLKEYHFSGKVDEKVIILPCLDVHFDFDEAILTKEAQVILKGSTQILKANPKTSVCIAGYTSASGTESYNQRLSEKRANAVKEYLPKEGVIGSNRQGAEEFAFSANITKRGDGG